MNNTTQKNEQQEREAFEAWAEKDGYDLQRYETGEEAYFWSDTNRAWKTWQAALSRPSAIRAQAMDLHDEIMNLRCAVPDGLGVTQSLAYKIGHREARHAAAELSIRSLASQPVQDGYALVPDELRQIGELLRTQDNRYTEQPLFIVQQKRQIVGIDPQYLENDQIGWFDSDGMATEQEHTELEAKYQETGVEPDGWTRTGFANEWEFVTACFTEQGCKDYLAINGHNLKEPRIYADGSDRNKEYRILRKWLMSLAAPTAAQRKGE